jgi:hypothetical protein
MYKRGLLFLLKWVPDSHGMGIRGALPGLPAL